MPAKLDRVDDKLHRPAWLEIDLAAIAANARILSDLVAPAGLWAVVKADGYGHGAVPVAEAALDGGAVGLCVALVEEGVELRQAGIGAPILLLSEPPLAAMATVVDFDLTAAIYTLPGLLALSEASSLAEARSCIHIKIDTGMHRVGADAEDGAALISRAMAMPAIEVEGIFTHFANADDPDDPLTTQQAERLEAVTERYPTVPLLHCCNSAAALTRPDLRMGMVRAGIALYGISPGSAVALPAGIRPALALKAHASYAKEVAAGERISYGQRYQMPAFGRLLTVPVGYADGVPRALAAAGGEVLVNGRRCVIAGTVTMDQVTVNAGMDGDATVGTEVVLLGCQGTEEVRAEEWAARLGTIGYEIVCRFGSRLPRRYLGGPTLVDVREQERQPESTPSPED